MTTYHYFYIYFYRITETKTSPFTFCPPLLKVSFLIVDEMMTLQPDSVQDSAQGKAPVDRRSPLPDIEIHYTSENPQVVINNEVKMVTASISEVRQATGSLSSLSHWLFCFIGHFCSTSLLLSTLISYYRFCLIAHFVPLALF